MNCWSKKLFKQFKTYYGNSINECEKDFNGGDLKKIIVSLTMKLVIPPEEFLIEREEKFGGNLEEIWGNLMEI